MRALFALILWVVAACADGAPDRTLDAPDPCVRDSTTCALGDCDDDDPCTVDSCRLDPCADRRVCTYTWIPNCPVPPSNAKTCSAASDCHDADPCTDDACRAGTCVHAISADCGTDPRCHRFDAIEVDELKNHHANYTDIKVAGFGAVGQLVQCTASEAWDICTSGAALEAGHTAVAWVGSGAAPAPICTSDGQSAECDMVALGAPYYAWGEPRASLVVKLDLVVEGYCLQHDAGGLLGRYDATLLEDTPQARSARAFTIEVRADMSMGVSAIDQCAAGACAATQEASSVTQVGPRLMFRFELDGATVLAAVEPERSMLRGRFETASGTGPSGRILLERR